MTPTDLETAGRALYGDGWRKPLGGALRVHERTVRRWHAGAHPIPHGVRVEIARLCRERSAELVRIATGLWREDS